MALRNALIPAVTLTGVQFTFLVGGTVLIEYIFSYPGIGNLAIGAVIQRDLPLIQGLVLTFACLFIITNLLVDLSYTLLNPEGAAGMIGALAAQPARRMFGFVVLAALVLVAVFAPWLAPHDPTEQDLLNTLAAACVAGRTACVSCSAPTAWAATSCRG